MCVLFFYTGYVYVHILVMVFCVSESEKNDNLPVSRWDRIFHVTVLKRATHILRGYYLCYKLT